MSKGKIALIVIGVLFIFGVIAGAIGGGDDDDDSTTASPTTTSETAKTTEAATTSETAPTSETATESESDRDEDSTDSNPKSEQIADDVTDSLDIWFPDCKWEKEPWETSSKVFIKTCDELMVIAADTPTGVNSYLRSMAKGWEDERSDPWVLMSKDKDYAVMAQNEGNINLAWDVLGAEGKRKQLSEYQ